MWQGLQLTTSKKPRPQFYSQACEVGYEVGYEGPTASRESQLDRYLSYNYSLA